MTIQTRRRFLQQTALAAVLAGASGISVSRRSAAESWAPVPPGLHPNGTPSRIVQICCYGAMSQFDTLWLETLPELTAWQCGDVPSYDGHPSVAFAQDALGHSVHWGPALAPLAPSPLFDRARMVTLTNGGELPHQIGLLLSLTGLDSLGNARSSGLAAAIERHYQSVAPRALPYAYVLSPQSIGHFSYTRSFALRRGKHNYAPFDLRLGDVGLKQRLARAHVGAKETDLLTLYRAGYGDLLRFQGSGMVRSAGFDAYELANAGLSASADLDTLLASDLLDVDPGVACALPDEPATKNTTRAALRIGAQLMKYGGARHVTILDRGVVSAPGGLSSGYDSHSGSTSEVVHTNLWNLVEAIAECSEMPGASRGRAGDAKFDVSKTLFVITTEFTRTATSGGSNHSSGGFLCLLLGAGLSGRSIGGALTAAKVPPPEHAYSHGDLHAALLLAAGVWPFAEDNLLLGDLSEALRDGSNDEEVVANRLAQTFFSSEQLQVTP